MANNIQYSKPFKTYEQQINLLISRNVVINDYDFAKNALSSFSYYTLINGYKNTFLLEAGTDSFIPNTNFKDLYTLHIIDSNLNNIILKNILFAERFLKTRLAYLISQNYGVYTDPYDMSNCNPDDYLFRDNYRAGYGRNNILKSIKESLTSPQANSSVVHYMQHKNHVPAWILVTNIPFGLTIKWYDILKSEDKTIICNEFISDDSLSIEDKKEFLKIAISLLREYRNKIAHGHRAFSIQGLPVLPKRQLLALSHEIITEAEYNTNMGKSDLFAVILSCFILINDRYVLANFYRDLQYTLEPYINAKMHDQSILEILGLPADILMRLDKLLEYLFPDI